MPKITIGLPVYNGENYLAETIESVLSQTFEDFVLFISDDASTDATAGICRRYAQRDSRIEYIRRAVNRGGPANFAFVVTANESQYFKFQAHDDPLLPKFLETCVEVLDAQPEIVMAAPAFQLIDDDGKRLPYDAAAGCLIDRAGNPWPLGEDNKDLQSADTVERFRAVVEDTTVVAEQFGVMRQKLLQVPTQANYLGSDKPYLAKLALRGRFWLGSEVLWMRRLHSAGFSMAAAKDAKYRFQWFGQQSSNILLHKARFTVDYLGAVLEADLSVAERWECLKIIAHRAAGRAQLVARHGSQGMYVPNFRQGP